MIGIMPHGRALTGKEWSQDICHSDLWSKSRPQRASMEGSTLQQEGSALWNTVVMNNNDILI
jgi:hypothetical protein